MKTGYFSQDDAFRVVKLVVNVLVPMSLLVNIPKVNLELTHLALPATCIFYASVTIPLFRLLFKQVPEGLDRAQRGQMLACCTGHAVTLVGYPIIGGFYGPEGLAMCACWDLAGFLAAYICAFAISFLYSPNRDQQHQQQPEVNPPPPTIPRPRSFDEVLSFLSSH